MAEATMHRGRARTGLIEEDGPFFLCGQSFSAGLGKLGAPLDVFRSSLRRSLPDQRTDVEVRRKSVPHKVFLSLWSVPDCALL
jgi:hypothetical protein